MCVCMSEILLVTDSWLIKLCNFSIPFLFSLLCEDNKESDHLNSCEDYISKR